MGLGSFFKLLVLPFFLCTLLFFALPASAVNKKDVYLAGKVFDEQQAHPLKGVMVRIVNLETGESHQEKTGEDGCYSFKNIKEGTYSVSVSYSGQDYLLAEKVKVEKIEDRDVVVVCCVALGSENTLVQLQNCHVCKKGIPVLAIIIPAGAGAAAISSIVISGEPPASPSTP
jgi:hypothetical protein